MDAAFNITSSLLLLAAVALLNVCSSHASYTCCTEERRGTVCTLAGNGTADSINSPNASLAAFYWPIGVALSPPHNIIVSGHMEHRLRIIYPNGSVSTLAGGGPVGEGSGSYVDSDDPLTARFSSPYGICFGKEGEVLLSDCYNHRIRTVLRNGSVRTLAGTGANGCADSSDPLQAGFYHPAGIASSVERGQRLIIIGGNWDHRIRVIYANMTVSTLAGSGGTGYMNCDFKDSADPLAARFCHPSGVAQDKLGNIIVADQYTGRVRKVWRHGSGNGVTTIAGRGPVGLATNGNSIDSDNPSEASVYTPVGVFVDAAGNILVSARCEHRIRIVFVNGSVRTVAGSGPSTDIKKNEIGGFVDNVPLLEARFSEPYFGAIDEEGNAIIPDYTNHRIRILCTHARATLTPTANFATVSHCATNSTSLSHSSFEKAHSPSHTHTLPSSATTSSSHLPTQTPQTSSVPSPSATMTPSVSPRLLPQPSTNPISRLVSSEEVARAVVASGAAAAALAGFAATASMGHATRMGALMRSVECAFAAGELAPTSLVELPLQWNIESEGGSVGSHAGSALLTSAVLVVLPLLMCAFVYAILSSCGVSERPTLRSLQSSVLSRYCLLSMAFFAPNVLMSSVVVVGRGASSGAVVAAICAAIVPLLLGCVAGQRALAMDVEVVPLCGGKWELRNRPSSRAYVETFGGLVSGCRDPTPYIVRVCFLEDAAASLVLSFLSGVSLSTARCEWVALAMLVVSALHLLYVACVRPLRSALESAMNCCLSGVQVLMAALCLAIASGADNSGGVLMSVLGVVAVVQNASFFGQAAILAACACVSESRKKHTALSGAGPSGDTSMMMMPMSDHALLSPPLSSPLIATPAPMNLAGVV